MFVCLSNPKQMFFNEVHKKDILDSFLSNYCDNVSCGLSKFLLSTKTHPTIINSYHSKIRGDKYFLGLSNLCVSVIDLCLSIFTNKTKNQIYAKRIDLGIKSKWKAKLATVSVSDRSDPEQGLFLPHAKFKFVNPLIDILDISKEYIHFLVSSIMNQKQQKPKFGFC